MSERKMATLRQVNSITPIEGADAIETAHIDGWTVVVKKDEFKAGDAVIFCEIDAWVPHSIAPFLTKGHEPREYMGIKGEKLRTIRLRKQLSQGLVLDAGILPPAVYAMGQDVSELLGIVKYEPPLPAQLAGTARGNFPSFVPKTDQERIQNLARDLERWVIGEHRFEVTEKLDGSSMTVYFNNGDFGVCSRNLDLIETEGNTFWATANALQLRQKLTGRGRNIAVQGELVGEGIQGNKYRLKGHKFFVFDIYDIDAGKYLDADTRHDLASSLDLSHAPVIHYDTLLPPNMEFILKHAESKSHLAADVEAEGVVYKLLSDPSVSFKAISNKFLEKNKE